MNNLLEVRNLKKYFSVKGGVFLKEVAKVYAVDDVSFSIKEGETVGLVGESGCGKSTLARTIINLYKPTSGDVLINGVDFSHQSGLKVQSLRKNIQMIFQDPYESLNPRHTVEFILEEPFVIHKMHTRAERIKKVKSILDDVGLPQNSLKRFPHEFSGGQRQRIGIARALALNPKIIICDEPVSALDVSIQSQILNLLIDLQVRFKLTYLFIAHDLTVVKHISNRVIVMYLGKFAEITDSETIYNNPIHPYTRALLSSIPKPDPEKKTKRMTLKFDVPSPMNPPSGCRFHTRCPYMIDKCRKEEPLLKNIAGSGSNQHLAACHRSGDLIAGRL